MTKVEISGVREGVKDAVHGGSGGEREAPSVMTPIRLTKSIALQRLPSRSHSRHTAARTPAPAEAPPHEDPDQVTT